MTGPQNGRYQRRFANPADRPSNQSFGQWAAAETLRTVHGLNEWLDQQQASEVVAACERMTRAEAERLQRMQAAQTEDRQAGDPGE